MFTPARRSRVGTVSTFASHKRRRPALPSIACHALNTNDGTLCELKAHYQKMFRVACSETFPEYLDALDSRVPEFELPLGAALEAKPCGQVVLKVPRVSFMDLYIFPTTTVEIGHSGHEAHIRALDTTIEGSHHIQSLDCNNRFTLDLYVHLKGEEDILNASAEFALAVDVPPPLNITPKNMIEGTGTAAVQRVLTSLMDTLCASIVRDHVAWVKEQRAQEVASEQNTPVGAAA